MKLYLLFVQVSSYLKKDKCRMLNFNAVESDKFCENLRSERGPI